MQKQKNLFHRIPRFVFIAGGLILVLLITGSIISIRLKPFIAEKIKAGVRESTAGLYRADFTGIHVNIFSGSIGFDTLQISVDEKVLQERVGHGNAPAHIFTLGVKGIAFRHINLWKVYRNKNFRMGSLVIAQPDIIIRYLGSSSIGRKEEEKTAWQLLSKTLNSLQVDEIILNDATVKYIEHKDRGSNPLIARGFHIRVDDLRIDSASQHEKDRLFYARDIQVNLKGYRFRTPDSLYFISVGNLAASTASNSLRLTGLRVKPRYPEMEFSRKYPVQHDRYDLHFPEILLTRLDIGRLNTERSLSAGQLLINGARVNIFMNRELPPVNFDKGRNYPHVVIRRLKLNTIVDSLQIRNTRIAYSEYNPKSQRKGTVVFDRFNALLRNVTNDSLQLQKNNWMRARVSTWLMNRGRMDVHVNMNLTAENAAFNFTGTMGAMDMRELNALSRNMSLAEIASGQIQKAEFNVDGDWRNSRGFLKLYYQNLKVNILKNDENSNTLEKRGLISTLANTLIIKDENPDKSGRLRIGKTKAHRINSASFFNLMWKSIFEGLTESVGFTMDKPASQQTDGSDRKESRKQERQQRREQRRAERAGS